MFKKSKNNKSLISPAPPTQQQILQDIETFYIDDEPMFRRPFDNIEALDEKEVPLETWWQAFEQYMDDLKCLELIQSEILAARQKLDLQKLELESNAKTIKYELDEYQRKIKDVLELENHAVNTDNVIKTPEIYVAKVKTWEYMIANKQDSESHSKSDEIDWENPIYEKYACSSYDERMAEIKLEEENKKESQLKEDEQDNKLKDWIKWKEQLRDLESLWN